MTSRSRIVLGAVCLLILGAVAALAGERLRSRSASVTVAETSAGSVAAKCPRGSKAVSGGFEQEFEPDQVVSGNSPQLQQFASRRRGKRRWTGSAFNISDPGRLTVFAYCRSGTVEQKSKRVTIAGTPFMQENETGGTTAKCPKGTTLVSGGFANPTFAFDGGYVNDTRVLPYVSKRKGARGWKVQAQNGGGAEGTLVAFAYCDDRPSPLIERKSRTFTPPTDDVAVGTVVATCDRGQQAVSGGFAINGSRTPIASRKVGRRKWRVSASVPYPGDTRVSAYAYCEPRP